MKDFSEYINKNKVWLDTLEADLEELEGLVNSVCKPCKKNEVYLFNVGELFVGEGDAIELGDIYIFQYCIKYNDFNDEDPNVIRSIYFTDPAPNADYPFGWIRHAIAELKKREE